MAAPLVNATGEHPQAYQVVSQSFSRSHLDAKRCANYKIGMTYPEVAFPPKLVAKGSALNNAIKADRERLIASIAKDLSGRPATDDCSNNPTFLHNPEVYSSYYEVLRQRPDFISLAVFYQWQAGNGEIARTTDVYTYNLDLRTGQLVKAHDLLDSQQAAQLTQLVNKSLHRLQIHNYTGPVVRLEHVAFNDTAMRVYVSGTKGSNRNPYFVDLPYSQATPFLAEGYRSRF